jgi:F0F1-type ATP synthase assembly protein I
MPVEKKGGGRQDWGSVLRETAPYLSIGTALAVTVLVGLGGGYWLDGQFGTRPVFFLVGGILGLGAAMYHFMKTVSTLKRKD